MSSKGGGTQGYRYYMSLLMGLCRGPVDEVVEIKVGDETAWTGHQCGSDPNYINAPELFGGDDKEGGIQGPFNVFMGGADQELPPAAPRAPIGKGDIWQSIFGLLAPKRLPGVKESIGGRVSEMRGVATLWYDGLVSAMSPYLKEWKVRVRRSQKGWHGATWYPAKATIFLGGSEVILSTNRPIDFPIDDGTITFSRNPQPGDSITVNGQTISWVDDDEPGDFELKPSNTKQKSLRALANEVNARSTTFKATASYTANTVTIVNSAALAAIYAMNPAHIVYEALTNPLWGRGLDTVEDIDEDSFIYAANLFCAERFGICLAWYRKDDIDVFIKKVCDLAAMDVYTDRETGKTVIKPIRFDYDPDDVPLFTPETGLLAIDLDDSATADNAYSEIIGTSVDPVSNLEFQRRVHNLAAYQSQKAPSSLDQDYKGIPTKELLDRVLLRDLRVMSSGLKKYNLTMDRRGFRVTPGSVIRISHPKRQIANLILRINEIDDTDQVNGVLRMKATVDVFGLPATSYLGESENPWVAPSKVATPAPDEELIEASYRDLYRRLGEADAQLVPATTGYIGQLATPPNLTSLDYDLISKPEGGTYAATARGNFTGSAMLAADVTAIETVLPVKAVKLLDAQNIGQALLIGEELVALDAYDEEARTITVRRGVGDTVPAPHTLDDLIWTIDDDLVTDGIPYLAGETVYTRVLTRTSTEVLDPEDAEEQSIEITGRSARPYPPADVQLDGVPVYDGGFGYIDEPVFSWVDRNRITQGDALVGYNEGPVAAEAGTTYNARIYDLDDNLLAEHLGIASPWTYTNTLQAADDLTPVVRIEFESERDEVTSWQKVNVTLTIGEDVLTIDGEPVMIDGEIVEIN